METKGNQWPRTQGMQVKSETMKENSASAERYGVVPRRVVCMDGYVGGMPHGGIRRHGATRQARHMANVEESIRKG